MGSLGVPGDVTQIRTCQRLEGENKPGQALPTILRFKQEPGSASAIINH